MKKHLALITICVLILVLLCACGNKVDESTPQNVVVSVEINEPSEVIEVNTVDLPYGTDCGTGNMFLSYVSGTTENNNIIDVLAKKDTYSMQIGINAFDFDGSHFSFVYIDGVFVAKEQYGNSQCSLTLMGNNLSEGLHTVSVVQYENNDESGNIITYKEAKYNIVY